MIMSPHRHPHRPDSSPRRFSGLLLSAVAALAVAASSIPSLVPLKPDPKPVSTLPADTSAIAPSIPREDRHAGNRVFLERADRLFATERDTFQILVGDVMFRKADMFMYCDSAHFYGDNSLRAYGNVRMEQGDTLFVYADSLTYDGPSELAVLYAYPGKKVRLINRDVMLETDEFFYDLAIELGYYEAWGTLTDPSNTLTSVEGEYSPSTKDANFYNRVHLNARGESDTLDIFTDTLNYNTDTRLAVLSCFSRIVTADGVIFTSNGVYNTATNTGDLYDRSLVVTEQGNTLTADTLFYDRDAGFGYGYGNMIITDSARSVTLHGDYGFVNQLTDSAFVTGHALAKEYGSGADTLYLHGDTIRAFKVYLPELPLTDSTAVAADSTHYLVVNPRVRFYRSDLQGLCDSLTFIQIDSMLYMDRHPVVWSDNRQIFGNEITVHLNDSTADRATLPRFGFMAEEIEPGYYNQLTGREMIAYLENGTLRHLDVNGSVQAINFPEEADSTINKVASLESSYLAADFGEKTIERLKVWPQVSGTVTPLYLAKKSIFFLPQFKWYASLRPTGPDDVFNVSEEMLALLAQPEQEVGRASSSMEAVSPDASTRVKEVPPGRRVISVPRPAPPVVPDSLHAIPDSLSLRSDSLPVLSDSLPAALDSVAARLDSLRAAGVIPDSLGILPDSLSVIPAISDSIFPVPSPVSESSEIPDDLDDSDSPDDSFPSENNSSPIPPYHEKFACRYRLDVVS